MKGNEEMTEKTHKARVKDVQQTGLNESRW